MLLDRTGQSELLGLHSIALSDPEYATRRALAIARAILDMQVAFVAALTERHLVFRALEGDKESFGWDESCPVAIDGSYCRRMVAGEIPNVVADSRNDPVAKHLAATTEVDIGSYIGVPIWLADGTLYGSFCCLSHEPDLTLGAREVRFLHVMARTVADSIDHQAMQQAMADAALQESSTQALIAAVHAREPYTAEHSTAVVDLVAQVAEHLALTADQAQEVRQVALLHDVGKIGVPDSVLLKQGPLDEHEWTLMREHPAIGERIVRAIPGLAHLAPAIRAEHERWDGGGYPDGLAGEDIPTASRICLVCDAWHAMRSDRPYRKAMAHRDALNELRAHRGTQFWPAAVDALVATVEPGRP